MVDVKRIDVNLSATSEPEDEDVVAVVHSLRPEWNKEYETQVIIYN